MHDVALLPQKQHLKTGRVADPVSQVFGWSRMFVPLRKPNWIIFYITLISWEFLLKR